MKLDELKKLYDSDKFEELDDAIQERYYELMSVPVSSEDIKNLDRRIQSLIMKTICEASEKLEKLKQGLKDNEKLRFEVNLTPERNSTCEVWEYINCSDCTYSHFPLSLIFFVGEKNEETDINDELLYDTEFTLQETRVHYGLHHFTEFCYIPICDLVGVQSFNVNYNINVWREEEA